MFILRNEGLAAHPSHSIGCHPERSEGSAFLPILATSHSPLATKSFRIPVSDLCVLCVSVFSSPNLSSFNPDPSPRYLVSFVDALDAASSRSPLSATLTKNTRGWGGAPSFSANSVPSALKSTRALPSTDLLDAPHCPPHCSSFFHQSPVTSHQSQVTKSFTIRTSANRTRNPFRMNTSKTKHLKLFRINTYEKTGGGEEVNAHSWPLTDSHLAHTRNAATSFNSCGCAQLSTHPGVGGVKAPARFFAIRRGWLG